MLVPEKTSGPRCVTSRPSDSVRTIASLKSERLKTPNEGSKPEFHLRWIRELVPINALVLTGRANFRVVGKPEVIRIIRYGARWRRFFRYSLAASDFRSRPFGEHVLRLNLFWELNGLDGPDSNA
jgi:hypothetical protein